MAKVSIDKKDLMDACQLIWLLMDDEHDKVNDMFISNKGINIALFNAWVDDVNVIKKMLDAIYYAPLGATEEDTND